MRKRMKRTLSLAMVLAILLSCMPVSVWAAENSTDIQAIQKPTGISIVEDYDDYFGDNWVEKLELPETVKLTLADGSTTAAPVVWDTSVLDTRTTGFYSLPGDVTLPAGVTNGQNLTASITIQVREYVNLLSNPGFEEGTKNWYVRGDGTRYTTDYVRTGTRSALFGAKAGACELYNSDYADLAARVTAQGAGQYYFGIWARQTPDAAAKVTNVYAMMHYKKADTTGNPIQATNGTSSKLAVVSKADWTQVSGICTLDADITYLRLRVYGTKDVSTTWDTTGMRFDDAQLVPLKVALKAEPAAVAQIKTEILSRFVVLNYPDYVGENWKSALGLPTSVEVLTDNNTTVDVGVTWSYAEVDFSKTGKYTLVGTLDDSAFPNPKGITVQQNIYVVKANNLITNSSFESDLAGWYLRGQNPNPSRVTSPVKDGKYAAMTGNWSVTGKQSGFAESKNMDALGAVIAKQGGGQYYYSAWAQSSAETVPDGLLFQQRLLYKTTGAGGVLSSAVVKTGNQTAFSNSEFVQSRGVVDLPANTAWVRLDAYVLAQSNTDIGHPLYLDCIELIPLNVTIPKGAEPADVTKIIDEIPARAVVKNYDSFVGSGWRTALGLPDTVKVLTSKGNTVSVGVTWDLTPLKLNKVGKYTLVGTLDDSTCPNPLNLYVTQVIYVREYKNLLSNPSLEGTLNDWYLRGQNPNPGTVSSPVKDGKFAGMTGKWSITGKQCAFAESKNMEALAAAVGQMGSGQYYFSAWSQASQETVPAGLSFQTRILYKTADENGVLSNAITKTGDKVALSNTQYVQSTGILDLPVNTAWVRFDGYVLADNSQDIGQQLFFDHAELVALNVTVERYEGAMEQIKTVIPERRIIKNYPDYIGASYTTADLMLPETVEVITTAGQLVTVGVIWDYENLNLSKTGKYTLTGKLEDMKLDNPKALTVDQVIYVVEYTNLISNGSFENDNNHWSNSANTTVQGVTSPVKDGDLSLKITVDNLDGRTNAWLQTLEYKNTANLGHNIVTTGAGRYFFGVWAQGTDSSADYAAQARFWYRCYSTGDSSVSNIAPSANLSASQFVHSGNIVEVPDDVYWARIDLFLVGEVNAMRKSIMYADKMELVPLNVAVPGMNDIIDCGDAANVYVHKGTSFADLKLPETLEVQVKSGQKLQLKVNWNVKAYDPNKLGAQTITGSLDLAGVYKNIKDFVPDVVVTVRAPGEPLRETIYISVSGSEENDGLSPNRPKKEVTNIPKYLKQGYNVRLKRGDTWYLPLAGLTFADTHGTEDVPLVLGAYGEGDALPTIAYLMKIEDAAWTLVDAKRNIYAADVSTAGQRNGEYAHRVFVNDVAYTHKSRSNYVALDAGEFCSYGGMLYIRMAEGAPSDVEMACYNASATRVQIKNASHLTIEYIHFKGGNPRNGMMRIDAPTEYIKFQYCSITHGFYYILTISSENEAVNYKPEISHCYIDSMINEEEGAINDELVTDHWDVSVIEGIVMREGVDGAWIHHNTIRQMSHAFIAIESLSKGTNYKTTGVRNCIIEDNVLEAGNALYARAFNICGGFNQSGVQMCRDNTYRRNKCYDMNTSSQLYGENNLIYSNVISYLHNEYTEDGELFDGNNPQPYAFDTIPWNDHTSVGNMVINNTFYDVAGAIALHDTADTVYNNIYANNLIVNWTSDPTVLGIYGGFYDYTTGINYVMNNGFYAKGRMDHIVADNMAYQAADVNNAMTGYSGNVFADPMFLNADLTLSGKNVRQDFTLGNASPMRYAGLSLYASVYESFPAWERLKAQYTDINGVVYLAESPSIGAYSFCEKIKGDVAEVGKLDDILARPGASFDQLNLPDAVPATNDQGIEVMLLTTWSDANFDCSKPGIVTLTAQLRNGPHTELNINGKVATININVKDKLELLNISTVVKNQTVLYGTSLEDVIKQLPQTLDVMEESGYQEALPVSWTCANYDPVKPDVYTFKCVLPEDMLTNARAFDLEVDVRVLHEIGRGMELLVNPDFNDGSSAAPWKHGWGTGSYKVTTDPQYLLNGEPTSVIVTTANKFGSIQQDVLGQMQLMGDGKYLFKVYMRAYDPSRPLTSSYACLKVWGPNTYVVQSRVASEIGTDWVEFSAIANIHNVAQATEVTFHASTGKAAEDVQDEAISYIIAGCSLIYLGKTDADVEATLDSVGLTWETIMGNNSADHNNVMSDLNLPNEIGSNSKITWTSSDESVITKDGKVIMGRLPKTVTLTATITYNGIETVKKFTVTVPRDPKLPVFTGSLTGNETANIGDEISFTISLKGENADSFNAYRFTMSFSTDKLEYVGITDPTSTVEVDGRRITISGIGTERPLTDTITVTFKVKKSGITEVKLVQVEMDSDPNVTLDTLPTMEVKDGTVIIDVAKADDPENEAGTNDSSKMDAVVIIIIVLVVGLLAVTGVVIILVIKKKKQLPPAIEE